MTSVTSVTDNRFWQFNNTKMCKFEVLGRCKKGRDCPFAHQSTDLRPLPDLRCTKLCKSLILTGICANNNCGYAHSKDELRSTGAFHKTKMCRFMKSGHCALGVKCNFAHSNSELRDTDTPEKTDPLPQGMPLPPGLGYEEQAPFYEGYDETNAGKTDMLDLHALAYSLDAMLAKRGQVPEASTEIAPSTPKAPGLANDSPAYIRLSSTPEAGRISGVTTRPFKGNDHLGQLSFDYLNCDDLSISGTTRSPPGSPPSPPTSDTGSGLSDGKKSKEMSPASLAGVASYNYFDHELAFPGMHAEGFGSNYFEQMPRPWESLSSLSPLAPSFSPMSGFSPLGASPYGLDSCMATLETTYDSMAPVGLGDEYRGC